MTKIQEQVVRTRLFSPKNPPDGRNRKNERNEQGKKRNAVEWYQKIMMKLNDEQHSKPKPKRYPKQATN